ncbi:unnamed protein product [Lactuca saligna]|uniref:NAC domain-containing protein n=1 Tax=Lactuca saligna TaxID=75948 RepID=A0AA35Z0J1_LACSI|nr:unnamed protein product [Lactuca saligna]
MEMEDTLETSRTTAIRKIQMPIGYRFRPTDEEIIIHYLRPKVFSFPLPATAILHAHHLFLHHPSRLPGNPKEKKYFFCKTSSHRPFSNPAGFWKPIINSHKFILAPGCNHPIGFKKCFVFYQISNQRRSRTPWILHQFRLLYPLPNKMEEWTVCSIHMSKKHNKSQQRIHKKEEESIEHDSMEDDFGPPQQTLDDGAEFVETSL